MEKIKLKKINNQDWNSAVEIEKSQLNNRFYSAITTVEDFEKYMKDSEVYLIYQNKDLVGEISFESQKDSCEMNGLVILPEFQNKGIATDALSQIVKIAKENDFKTSWLVTHPENSIAIRLYLKEGFKVVAWLDNFFGDGEPRLKLEKNL